MGMSVGGSHHPMETRGVLGIFFIPGNLSFRIIAIVLRYEGDAFGKSACVGEIIHNFFVSNGRESRAIYGKEIYNIAYFFYKSRVEHRLYSLIYVFVE